MMNEFLRFGTTGTGTGTGGESGGVGTGTVVSDNGLRVWLRTTPNGKRIQLYRPGTAVTILSYGGEWHYISIGGVRGYMMSRYISVTPAPAPSSKMVEAVSVNYPSPVVDDVLQASVTPSDATVTYSWKVNGVEQSNSATLRVLNDYIGKPITLTVTGTGVYYGSRHHRPGGFQPPGDRGIAQPVAALRGGYPVRRAQALLGHGQLQLARGRH